MKRLMFSVAVVACLLQAVSVQAQKTPVDGGRIAAHTFDLGDVRLLDGPFEKARRLDAEYLLRLEPDRLLSWFRKEAGPRTQGERVRRLGIAAASRATRSATISRPAR